MTLTICTSNKKVQLVKSVFVPALGGETGLQYKFEPMLDDVPPVEAGEVLLMCGGFGVELLQDEGLAPKNRTIFSLREKPIDHPNGGKILVTYDPGITQREADKLILCQWDVRLASRLARLGTMIPKVGKYTYTTNFNAAISHVRAAYEANGGNPIPISIDLETIGLDPYRQPDGVHPGARIISVSVTHKIGQAEVYYVPKSGADPEVIKQLELLITSPKVNTVGANWKFDQGWLFVHWQIACTNARFDTTLVGSLLNENISNSLNIHAKLYTEMGGYDDEFNRKYDKARMDMVPKNDLLPYAGGDTDADLRVYHVLKSKLTQDPRLTNFYIKLLQPASRVFAKLEHRGIVVDLPAYKALQKEVKEKEAELHAEAIAMLPRKLRIQYRDKLRLTRPVIMRDFLFTGRGLNLEPLMLTAGGKEGKGPKLPSTSMDHLNELLYQNPNKDLEQFVGLVGEWSKTTKTLSTYIVGFLKHLRSDGKFHPSYMLYRGAYGEKDKESGTVTGRLSCKDPAWQTLVKHNVWAKPLRRVYPPPKGMAILKLDFSQGELRITACVADEQVMIHAYQSGIDLHLKTGAMVNGYELDEALKMMAAEHPDIKEIRQGGKAGNFGLIYDMSALGFQNYAKTEFGVHWSLDKCEIVRNQFFDTYPGLHPWHDQYRELAQLHGEVRNPLGRIRHLPLISSSFGDIRSSMERKAINSPIQSCLSDMMLLAMVEIDKQYPDLWMVGMVHDDLMVYVPEDEVEQWAMRLKQIMENLPFHEFGWKPQLMFPVDAEASLVSLADCEELKL
jgi:DNA polymerase I-like protein with 3'-5' exonuclease and polymerase domains